MPSIRLGTRKSALAQIQAHGVADRLKRTHPDLQIEILLITTSGDRLQSSPVKTTEEGGLKALFTKEIEEALLDNRIDLAVHSLKDMAAQLPKGLIIGAVPEREDPRDVWISKNKTAFRDVVKNAKIGTGAVRRQAQLKHLFPSIQIVPIRGNVDTRLAALSESDLDGIILALAGLRRLGREDRVTDILSSEMLVPAVGQGCLGIQIREKDARLKSYLKPLDHPDSHAAANAERAFLKALGGSCQTPIAGYAQTVGKNLVMLGLVISPDGTNDVRAEIRGFVKDAEAMGEILAKKLLAAGGDKILSMPSPL